jgi:hypothetical protein
MGRRVRRWAAPHSLAEPRKPALDAAQAIISAAVRGGTRLAASSSFASSSASSRKRKLGSKFHGILPEILKGGLLLRRWAPPARASGYRDHPHGGSGDPQLEAPVGHRRWPPRSGRSAWLFFYRSDQQACGRTKGAAGGLPRQVAWSPGAIAQRPVHAHLNDDSKPAIPPSPSPKSEPSNIDHPVGTSFGVPPMTEAPPSGFMDGQFWPSTFWRKLCAQWRRRSDHCAQRSREGRNLPPLRGGPFRGSSKRRAGQK